MATTTTDKALAGLNNLVKLLPTTTVLTFQTLTPSFTNHGQCLRSNTILTTVLIAICTITCALASITDSIVHNGKLYYGIATPNGFNVFNFNNNQENEEVERLRTYCNTRYNLRYSDGIHVVFTVIVFLSLSFSDGNVQSCFFTGIGSDGMQLLSNLPLGLGILASLVFLLIPRTRNGIGYSTEVETLLTLAATSTAATPSAANPSAANPAAATSAVGTPAVTTPAAATPTVGSDEMQLPV